MKKKYARRAFGFFTRRKGREKEVVPLTHPSGKHHGKPSKRSLRLIKRIIFLIKSGQLQKGTLSSQGEVLNPEPVSTTSGLGHSYENKCPGLHPAKAAQRTDLIKNVDGGTVLETHAGRGNVTKNVYAKKLDKAVLVDKDGAALATADSKLDGKIKHEIIKADNIKWLENEMHPKEVGRLKVVDFDPFGSPSETMSAFFDNYPINRSMFIAVTDGSKKYLGYVNSSEGRQWLKQHYGLDMKADGSREDQVKVLDAFMQKQGGKHGFKVEPINVAYGRGCAVYAGYKISPK